MDAFVKVIKKDPQVRIKIDDMLDRYIGEPNNYQSKIGYDSLIQIVIPKERINLMSSTLVDIDTELKMKINRIKNLESKKHRSNIYYK